MIDKLNFRYLLWLLLALPSLPILIDFYFDERYYSELMYDSGVWSVQLFIVTLAITPFRMLTRSYGLLKSVNRWLMRYRRDLGVASFAYALIHLLVYLREYPDLADIIEQMFRFDIATGWIAMLVFTALAVTSNNRSLRALGHRWKLLHRLVYPSILLLYLHWLLIGFFVTVLHLWFVPLVVLQLYRIAKTYTVRVVSDDRAQA